MQDTPRIPHTWQEFVYFAIVAVIAGGGTWLATWFRKDQSKADTEKTRAETRSIDLASTMHAGDMVIDLIKLAAQAQVDVEQLRREKEFQFNRAETLKAERDLLQYQLDSERIRIGKP